MFDNLLMQRPVARRFLHALLALAALCCAPAFAIQPDHPGAATPKLTRAFIEPRLQVLPDLEPSLALDVVSRSDGAAAAFLQRHGGSWEVRHDRRSDRPNLIQGSGVALLPGRGNILHNGDLGLHAAAPIDLAVVERELQQFIKQNHALLGSDGLDFMLDPENSAPFGDGNTHWFMAFQQHVDGVPVDEAYLFFRISHGNIIQFGNERVVPVEVMTQPTSRRENAFELAWRELAFPQGTRLSDVLDEGQLRILPMAAQGEQPATRYNGIPGNGYQHVLAWRFVFRVDDDPSTYEVLMDAQRNRILEVRNLTVNVDATISGGIYPVTNTDPEITVPMPFLAVSNGGAKVTDALGIYDYSGGTATTSLDGRYIRINDNCGAISLSSSIDGNLNLGNSGGTDCTTPGVGGPGNTHAARSGFYHLTRINRKAAGFHPGNAWLQGKLTARMNINDTCNANWNGTTVNFFKSGAGCSNTGELAAVFLHEWGHGMDSNTGGSANENASGEAVGDTFAFLETGDACIGENFQPGVPCHNCNTGCTGVRDVSVFSSAGTQVIASPATITDPQGADCGRYNCPYFRNGFPYNGPMGYQGHCESLIASSANWDLTQALVDRFGSTGWDEMDRIWYGSLVPSKSAYRVASGGTCNVNAEVDGCGATNWYTVFLAVDDDDGDLSNGTPNACRIWDAFDAHGIACGARPPCSNDFPDFRISLPEPEHSMCAPGDAALAIAIGSNMDFANPVTLAAGALPAGIDVQFSRNPAMPGSSANMTLSVDSQALAGNYSIVIDASAMDSPGHEATAQLNLSTQVPAMPQPLLPMDGALDQPRQPGFSWAEDPDALHYTVEIARDAAFTDIVASATVEGLQWTPATPLQPLTTHYWRVRASSFCGESIPSAIRPFTTGATFPEPYCAVSFPSGVEPITRVMLSAIDHASPVAASSPAHEDFLAAPGGMLTAGHSHEMRVEGTTAGNWTTYVSAYIDWNQDGVFSSDEAYQIGTLTSSTGNDGQQAVSVIEVPEDALHGPTRMRVLKRYSQAAPACNTSGYGQAEDYTVVVASPDGYQVGGTATGLQASGLQLQLNDGPTLAVASDGAFSFPALLPSGDSYLVEIVATPADHSCALDNASGTVGHADVDNVIVTCTFDPPPTRYTVGGDVHGLQGTGLMLQLNGESTLEINADGPFVFMDTLAESSAFAVTVSSQPQANPPQECVVDNGSGTIGSEHVRDVTVSCRNDPDWIFRDGFEASPQ